MTTEGLSAAEVLRRAREDRGLTVRSAALELGIAPSQLSRIERGLRGISEEAAESLASYYGMTPDQIALAKGEVPVDVLAILQARPDLLQTVRKLGRGS